MKQSSLIFCNFAKRQKNIYAIERYARIFEKKKICLIKKTKNTTMQKGETKKRPCQSQQIYSLF